MYRRSTREFEIFFLDDRFRFRLFSLFAIVKKMENNYLKHKIHNKNLNTMTQKSRRNDHIPRRNGCDGYVMCFISKLKIKLMFIFVQIIENVTIL